MNVLFINQHFPPDPAPTGTLLAELGGALASRGHKIHVLTGRPTYDEVRGTSVSRDGTHGAIRVTRLPLMRRFRGTAGRLAHYTSFAVSLLFAGIRAPRPEVILAFSSTPLLGGLAALAIARLRRVPFVYVVQDVYPEVAVALGVLRPGLIARLATRIESHTWRAASRLILIAEDLAPIARERGVPAERIRIVPNWADVARILPQTESAFRREVGIDRDAFVVQYAGNLGRSQDLDTVLECARLIEERLAGNEADVGASRRVQFLFVGSGARAAEVQSRASTTIRFAPLQPAFRVGEVLAAADVALIPLQTGLTRYSVPSKVYSILASGRAVGALIDAQSEVARIVEGAQCGFRVDPGDAQALAREILRLAADPERTCHMGRRAREWSERHGTLERAARDYESVLTQVAP